MNSKPILDNRADGGKAGDFLRKAIAPGAQVRAVSAYFSIYAHRHLRDELDAVAGFRFLFGAPASAAAVKTHDDAGKPFIIGEDGSIAPHYELEQKQAAKACAEWISRKSVQVRTLRRDFLHGKMYAADMPNGEGAAFCGSSNFTARGLGFASGGGNWELNIVADDKTRAALREWFDNLWKSDKVQDAKAQVLEELGRLGKNHSPEFVYYLTLYRLFGEELEALRRQESELRLEDSQIWKMLYRFQKDAVGGIIGRLARHRVCILADSVGLGKTYTALAVMKYYENARVLVLCPKRLKENWEQFLGKRIHNPLAEDRFRYDVSAHTDLARPNNNIAWDRYDLVVIDESHYFRNATGARYKELRKALNKSGAKVLMLSATPINTSLKDLRNQIWLGAADDAFRRQMNIGSVEHIAAVSQRAFVEWTKTGARDKDALMESLHGDFLKMMDAVTIARSRSHIKQFYATEADGSRLDFPPHDKPQNERPPTDTEGELVYADLHRRIGEFGLSIYSPSKYLLNEDEEDERRKQAGEFTQKDREHYLIGMMRVNFLKRLESSPFAFCQTLRRTIDKIAGTESKIARFQRNAAFVQHQGGFADIDKKPPMLSPQDGDTADSTPEEKDMEEAEDGEEWTVGRKKIYPFSELRLDDWRKALKNDREKLESILRIAGRVVPARDAKLAKLKELLRDKCQNPTRNKDGGENRKALLFTSYADTARYVYGELKPLAAELGVAIALVVGDGKNQVAGTNCKSKYGDILRHFSPRGEKLESKEISILVATDCVSEGQNLQDCDYVINYDIHWNPVRIVQRFGRIDRIESKAARVRMTNFWPNIDLNEYLNLKHRVEERMALVAIGGSGTTIMVNEAEKEATKILEFRNKQLRQLQKQNLDPDAMDADGIGVSDFTLADFHAELLHYLQKNKEKFDRAPDGLCAVVAAEPKKGAHAGAIFCLKHKDAPADDAERSGQNRLHPHYLVYARDDGHVHFSHIAAIRSLRLFGDLCRGKADAIGDLCAAFDRENENDRRMPKYNLMLKAAVRNIVATFQSETLANLSADRGASLPKAGEYPSKAEDFALVSWLVIRDKR